MPEQAPKRVGFATGHRYWVAPVGMKVSHMVEFSHARSDKGSWQFLCAPWVGISVEEMTEAYDKGAREVPKCTRCLERDAEIRLANMSRRDALVGARLREFDIDLYRRLMFPGPDAEDNDDSPPEAA